MTEREITNFFDNIDFATNDTIGQNEINNEYKDTVDNRDYCTICDNGSHIIEDHNKGIIVCTSCGQIIGNLFDCNAEWKTHDDDGKGDTSRCTIITNVLLQQTSLGTTIGGGKSRIKTLHTWSAIPYRERSMAQVFNTIKKKCHRADIPKCIEDDAIIMFKTINDCKHTEGKNIGNYMIRRGTNRKSLIASCIFNACRKKGMTRSPKEIAELFGITNTEMTRGCKNFSKFMKMRNIDVNTGISLPEHFVERFCNTLKLKKQYIDEAVQIAKNIRRINLASDHTPFSVATSSILMMSEKNGLNINKKILSEKFNVSEVTIGKTYKKIEEYSQELTNDKIIEEMELKIKNKMDNIDVPIILKNRFMKFGIPYKEDIPAIDKFTSAEDYSNYMGQIINERKRKFELQKQYIDTIKYGMEHN